MEVTFSNLLKFRQSIGGRHAARRVAAAANCRSRAADIRRYRPAADRAGGRGTTHASNGSPEWPEGVCGMPHCERGRCTAAAVHPVVQWAFFTLGPQAILGQLFFPGMAAPGPPPNWRGVGDVQAPSNLRAVAAETLNLQQAVMQALMRLRTQFAPKGVRHMSGHSMEHAIGALLDINIVAPIALAPPPGGRPRSVCLFPFGDGPPLATRPPFVSQPRPTSGRRFRSSSCRLSART